MLLAVAFMVESVVVAMSCEDDVADGEDDVETASPVDDDDDVVLASIGVGGSVCISVPCGAGVSCVGQDAGVVARTSAPIGHARKPLPESPSTWCSCWHVPVVMPLVMENWHWRGAVVVVLVQSVHNECVEQAAPHSMLHASLSTVPDSLQVPPQYAGVIERVRD